MWIIVLFIAFTASNHLYFYYYNRWLNSFASCPEGVECYIVEPSYFMVYVALGSMIITGIGTFSSLILSFIKERRDAKQTKLTVEKLEMEIAELKLKAVENNKSQIIIK